MSPGHVKHHRTLTVICVLWTLAIAALLLTEQRYGRAEVAATDWLTTNGAARRSPQHPQLVFLALDDASKSLDAVFADDLEKSRGLQLMKQPFPWSREIYALIIDRLAQAGARAIILDMMFPAPRFGDKPFREALNRWPDRVVIGTNFKDVADDVDAAQTTVNRKPVHIQPTPVLRPPGPGSWLGFVNVRTDEDQIVRRVSYRTTALEFFGLPPTPDSEELLSLAARGLEKAGYARLVPATRESVRVRLCEEILPRSLYEIFVETQWAAPPYNGGKFFHDKIVLIGAAGNQAEDRLTTPLGTVLAPTIHLNAINAALNADFIHETEPWENLALIAAAGLMAWLLGARIANRPLRLLLLGLLLAGYYGGAQWLYNSAGLLPILLGPVLTLAGSGLTWTVFEQALDLREQQRVRRTLERYVSRDVVREILDNPETFLNSLGGERRSITVLFSDIRSFTTMTERADPNVLVAQLNEYFNEMVGIVFAHDGTLDKFIGDSVMAHWGSIVNRIGDAPLGKDGEEIRKRITTFLNAGRRFTHFANCQVHIEDQTFIGLITSPFFNARNLGSTDSAADLMLPNESDYSRSANMGLTFREDLERRLRRITLFLAAENQNEQRFKREDLIGWIGENRGLILSDVASLVTRWMAGGEPKGPTPFASFPEWSRVVGGVMAHAGLGDPCLAHTHDELETGGDRAMRAMRALYRLGYEAYPETWFEKGDLFKLMASRDDDDLVWFGSFADDEVRSTKPKIGLQLRKFRGRELDGIILQIDGSATKSERQQLRFVAASVHSDAQLVLGQVFGGLGGLGGLQEASKTPENNSETKKG